MQRRIYSKGNKMGADIKAALNIPDEGYSEKIGHMQCNNAKIRHYDLYITDGFINTASGAWPAPADNTVIAGWTQNTPETPAPNYAGPVYVWGFTDVDPNISGNLMTVPAGAYTEATSPYNIIGTEVGNAKFPAPFLDCYMGEHVFITVHNRGFFQRFQQHDVGAVQDDHTLHLHGIHAQTPYDGFPESAGTYIERLRYFWLEPWYKSLGNTVSAASTTTRQRDNWWNSLTLKKQQDWLKNTPLIKDNFLDNGGAILSQFSNMDWPMGVGYELPAEYAGDGLLTGTWKGIGRDAARYPVNQYTVEEATQFTYYFTPMHMGTYMYHCHMLAAEHVQMGMYGALVVKPADYSSTNKTAYGRGTKTEYDVENTIIVSEFDPRWHRLIESFGRSLDPDITSFKMADWKPELWFVNGRTFPQSILDFKWNPPAGFIAPPPGQDNPYVEPRYNTLIAIRSNKKFLTRWINMGYQEHPMHQHGWHMGIVGKDAMLTKDFQHVYTVLLGSGETYDTITLANPVYGVTDPAGSPLSSASDHFIDPITGAITPMTNPTIKWRQIYPVHDHDDYRVTTNDIYPGGGLVLIVVTDVPNTPPGTPTWMNPYTGDVEPLP